MKSVTYNAYLTSDIEDKHEAMRDIANQVTQELTAANQGLVGGYIRVFVTEIAGRYRVRGKTFDGGSPTVKKVKLDYLSIQPCDTYYF